MPASDYRTAICSAFAMFDPISVDGFILLKGSRRQRRRYSVRWALELSTTLQVCALNFGLLGMPKQCPPSGCRGPLTGDQQKMVEGLRDRTRSLSRLVGDVSTGCGSKITAVQDELASTEAVVDSLRDLSYGTATARISAPTSSACTAVVPTVAHRVTFPGSLKDFDPIPKRRLPGASSCTHHFGENICSGGGMQLTDCVLPRRAR